MYMIVTSPKKVYSNKIREKNPKSKIRRTKFEKQKGKTALLYVAQSAMKY